MALRLGDWKGRAVLAAVIAAGFLLTGAGVALMERSRARWELQAEAITFARLSTGPIADAYRSFFKAGVPGFYRFRAEILDRKNLHPSLERIQVVDMRGQVGYDSKDMETPQASPSQVAFSPAALAAVVGQDRAVLVGRREAAAMRFEVVDPHLEEWGRHEVSVVYSFDIQGALNQETRRRRTLVPMVLAGAAVTIAVVLALLRRAA